MIVRKKKNGWVSFVYDKIGFIESFPTGSFVGLNPVNSTLLTWTYVSYLMSYYCLKQKSLEFWLSSRVRRYQVAHMMNGNDILDIWNEFNCNKYIKGIVPPQNDYDYKVNILQTVCLVYLRKILINHKCRSIRNSWYLHFAFYMVSALNEIKRYTKIIIQEQLLDVIVYFVQISMTTKGNKMQLLMYIFIFNDLKTCWK